MEMASGQTGGRALTCQEGCLKENTALGIYRKREKVTDGPEPRVCKAGHERKNCGKLRVRW